MKTNCAFRRIFLLIKAGGGEAQQLFDVSKLANHIKEQRFYKEKKISLSWSHKLLKNHKNQTSQ